MFFYVFLVCAIQSIQDTTNFPNVHVHLPEIRRKAGLVGHTGHHYTTSTPHLAGQLRVGEAAQDRGPRRCLSHPWSMSITYHRTYHFNGSSMFKSQTAVSCAQFTCNKVSWQPNKFCMYLLLAPALPHLCMKKTRWYVRPLATCEGTPRTYWPDPFMYSHVQFSSS